MAAAKPEDDDSGIVRPVIRSTYEHFQPQNVPFGTKCRHCSNERVSEVWVFVVLFVALSYFSVLAPLLDLLTHVYRKFADDTCSSVHIFDAVRRLDASLQVFVSSV